MLKIDTTNVSCSSSLAVDLQNKLVCVCPYSSQILFTIFKTLARQKAMSQVSFLDQGDFRITQRIVFLEEITAGAKDNLYSHNTHKLSDLYFKEFNSSVLDYKESNNTVQS